MVRERKFKKASLKQIMVINTRLAEHLAKQPSGNWAYANRYDDSTIALEAGCSVSSVAKVRLELYGSIRPAAHSGSDTEKAEARAYDRAVTDAQRSLNIEIAGLVLSSTQYREVQDAVRRAFDALGKSPTEDPGTLL